jgi:hypothetical protein
MNLVLTEKKTIIPIKKQMAKHVQSIALSVRSRVFGNGRGWVFTPKHFQDLGSDAAIDSALRRLKAVGTIRQLARGLYETKNGNKTSVVEYEPDSDLRDTEQVPLLEDGGIVAFITREVLPYTPDAWVKEGATKIGYEISFTRHFYKPQPLRTLEEIRADIIAAEQEAEGVLDDLLKGGRT